MLEGKDHIFILTFWLDRYTEIERENRMLLDKMTSILGNR